MPRALRDLAGIYERIGANSSDAARAWYLGLRQSIRSLTEIPDRCPLTPEHRSFRHLLYGNKPQVYRVIFRILARQKLVEVVHIRHGARDHFELDESQ